MTGRELIEEIQKQDLNKEVQIKDTIFIGCRKDKDNDGECNTPFFDKINIPIQIVTHNEDNIIIEINRYA